MRTLKRLLGGSSIPNSTSEDSVPSSDDPCPGSWPSRGLNNAADAKLVEWWDTELFDDDAVLPSLSFS